MLVLHLSWMELQVTLDVGRKGLGFPTFNEIESSSLILGTLVVQHALGPGTANPGQLVNDPAKDRSALSGFTLNHSTGLRPAGRTATDYPI